MSNSFSTPAIVLRTAPYRDFDRMLTLLSPTYGKISACARGCRRPKAKLVSCTEVLCVGEYHFLKSKDHLTLLQCDLEHNHYSLRFDLTAMNYAAAVLSLAEEVATVGHEEAQLYELVICALGAIMSKSRPVHDVFLHFLLHLMDLIGFRPEVEQCVECQGELQGNAAWDAALGGTLCATCHRSTPQTHVQRTRLSPHTRQWLDLFLSTHVEHAQLPALDDIAGQEMKTALSRFVSERLERPVDWMDRLHH